MHSVVGSLFPLRGSFSQEWSVGVACGASTGFERFGRERLSDVRVDLARGHGSSRLDRGRTTRVADVPPPLVVAVIDSHALWSTVVWWEGVTLPGPTRAPSRPQPVRRLPRAPGPAAPDDRTPQALAGGGRHPGDYGVLRLSPAAPGPECIAAKSVATPSLRMRLPWSEGAARIGTRNPLTGSGLGPFGDHQARPRCDAACCRGSGGRHPGTRGSPVCR